MLRFTPRKGECDFSGYAFLNYFDFWPMLIYVLHIHKNLIKLIRFVGDPEIEYKQKQIHLTVYQFANVTT